LQWGDVVRVEGTGKHSSDSMEQGTFKYTHTINASRRSQVWSGPILAFISRSRHYSFTMTFPVSMPLLAVKELGQSCDLV
jgi:hypothetical protein